MLYRIRSVVSYNYYHENAEEMVKELFANDETFAKMIQIVHKNIINLFSGTDPDHKVVGIIEQDRKVHITRTMEEKKLDEWANQHKSQLTGQSQESEEDFFLTAT